MTAVHPTPRDSRVVERPVGRSANWHCRRLRHIHRDLVLPLCSQVQLARSKVLLANGTSSSWQGPPCSLELDSRILRAARLAPR